MIAGMIQGERSWRQRWNRLSRGKRIVIILVAVNLVPIPKVMVHEWTIRVVDERGSPLAGVLLWLQWDDYTFSQSGWKESRTNEAGLAVFPKTTVYLPIGGWLLGAIANLGAGVHASFGHFAYVRAVDDRLGNWTQGVNCSPCATAPLESEIHSSYIPPPEHFR